MLSLILATVVYAAVADGVKVEKGDELVISIRGVPQGEQAQVNGNYQVSSKGELFLPYIHQSPLMVEGLSAIKIARAIEEAYKKAGVYTKPVISVVKRSGMLMECGPGRGHVHCRYLTVSGQVGNPGPQVYRPWMRLVDVVNAVGPTTFAAQNRVELLRNGKVYKYNLKNEAHKNEKVYPMDQITLKTKRVIGR